MASLRRNKTLSPDGQTARFLYTIIKQLDLKSIDWNLVAGSLEITNGHAARMRYSRFKQHMEGVTTQPRAPRTGGKKEKEGKEGLEKPKKGKKRALEEVEDEKKRAKDEWQGCVKRENLIPEPAGTRLKAENGELRIKPEPDAIPALAAVQIKREPGFSTTNHFHPEAEALSAPVAIKSEPFAAGRDDDPNNPDIWRVLPQSSTTAASEHSFLPQFHQSVIDPVLTIQHPPPGSFSLFNPPPPASQQTVSLAQLEVPLRLPRMAHASASRQIKTEPEAEPEVEWLAVPPKAVAGLRIKNEPVEI